MIWTESEGPGRTSPKECIRNAREALNRAYSHPGISDGSHALTFIAEAVDWQRRALEQMASPATASAPESSPSAAPAAQEDASTQHGRRSDDD